MAPIPLPLSIIVSLPVRRRRLCIIGIAACLTLASAAGLFLRWTAPMIGPDAIVREHGKDQTVSYPIRVRSTEDTVSLSLSFIAPPLSARRYHLFFLGCIDTLAVNGVPVALEHSCDEGLGVTADFSGALHRGKNSLTADLRPLAEPHLLSFTLQASRTDPLVLCPILLLIFLLVLATALLQKSHAADHLALLWIFMGGILLRILYLSATPWSIRSLDWQGHMQYIGFIFDFHRLPDPAWGWQTYQPPLYYILSAVWTWLMQSPNRSFASAMDSLQLWSLLLSCGQLVLMLWIGLQLFPDAKQRHALRLYALIVAVFPGVLFFSSRISNDVAALPLATLTLALLLRWWKKGSIGQMVAIAVSLGIGLLTKSTALPLLACVLLLIPLHPLLSWRRRALHAVTALVIVTAIAGPYFVMLHISGMGLIGNVASLDPGLRISTSFWHLFSFNPLRILLHPIVGSFPAGPERQYLWEMLFRTALVGNATFTPRILPAGFALLYSGLLVIPILAVGMASALRRGGLYVPLLLCTIVLLLASALARVLYPFVSTQDFRYCAVLLVPCSAFVAVTILSLRGHWKTACQWILYSFLALAAAFPVMIFLAS